MFFLLKCGLLHPFYNLLRRRKRCHLLLFFNHPLPPSFKHGTTPMRNWKSRRLPLLLPQKARKRSFLFCPSISLPFLFIKQKSQIRFMSALPFSYPGSSLISQPITLPEHSSADIYSCSMPTDSAALPWQPNKTLLCVRPYHPQFRKSRATCSEGCACQSVGVLLSLWLRSALISFFTSQLPLNPLQALTCHS